MKNWIIMHALTIAIPAIVGPLAYLVSRYVLNLWRWIDNAPVAAKRAIVFAIAFLLAAASQAAGLTLPGECSAVGTGVLTPDCQSALANPVWLKAILGAVIAFFMHALKKSEPAS